MKFKIVISTLSLLLYCQFSNGSVKANQIRIMDLSNVTNVSESIMPHQTANVLYQMDTDPKGMSSKIVIATGKSASMFAEKLTLDRKSSLCESGVNQLFTVYPLIHNQKNQILSGLTELNIDLTKNYKGSDNSEILVASMHAIINYLKSNTVSAIALFSDKKMYQIIDSQTGKYLDVIFIAKNKSDLINKITEASNSLNLNNQSWISWQFGSLGEEPTLQCSEGRKIIVEVKSSKNNDYEPTGFYGLPIFESIEDNVTSPGSSGSIVWTHNTNDNFHSLGIIQCIQQQPSTSAIKSLVRVLGFDRISNGSIEEVTESKLKESDMNSILTFHGCIPIDRGVVGAD